MTMNSVKTYDIATQVAGELNLAGYGTVPYSFEAGTATAATPQDEVILEHLASIGLAKPTALAEAVAPTTKKTSAKPAGEPTTKE